MKLKKWHIVGVIFTLILGTLLHFTYEWSNENPIIALLSPVNESTWEHLKLLFTPMLLFGILEYFAYGNKFPNFVLIRALSILVGMSTIIITFYTYVGIIGQHFLWADIATFVLGVLAAYWFSFKNLQTENFASTNSRKIGYLIIIVLIICFILFTFRPPNIGLFLDPTLAPPIN